MLYNLTAKEDGNQIIFDTNALKIYHIYQVINDVENNVDYSFGNKDEKLGQPLIMNIDYKQNDYIGIKIVFSTTQESIADKFLSNTNYSFQYRFSSIYNDILIFLKMPK